MPIFRSIPVAFSLPQGVRVSDFAEVTTPSGVIVLVSILGFLTVLLIGVAVIESRTAVSVGAVVFLCALGCAGSALYLLSSPAGNRVTAHAPDEASAALVSAADLGMLRAGLLGELSERRLEPVCEPENWSLLCEGSSLDSAVEVRNRDDDRSALIHLALDLDSFIRENPDYLERSGSRAILQVPAGDEVTVSFSGVAARAF